MNFMTQTLRGWFSELRKYFLTNFVLNLIYSIQLKKLAHFRVLTFKTRDGVHFRIPHPLPHKTLTVTAFIYSKVVTKVTFMLKTSARNSRSWAQVPQHDAQHESAHQRPNQARYRQTTSGEF